MGLGLQSTGYCKTWNGEPRCIEGVLEAATDIDFYLDIDTETGAEVVHVADVKVRYNVLNLLLVFSVAICIWRKFFCFHLYMGTETGGEVVHVTEILVRDSTLLCACHSTPLICTNSSWMSQAAEHYSNQLEKLCWLRWCVRPDRRPDSRELSWHPTSASLRR